MLHTKRQLVLDRPFSAWIREAASPGVVEVAPLDVEVVIALDGLPASFHGDPADRLIVATTRAYGFRLATHDRSIRSSRVAALWSA
jgi:PIN domain nuclease of toxin-antitoxin system